MVRPVLNQINLVCGDMDASLAFYRKLGVAIGEGQVWRTQTGAHHAGAIAGVDDDAMALDLDSAAFAQHWNMGWAGRADLRGRVVLGFALAGRDAVDALYQEMTGAGYAGLQAPYDALWGARYAVIEDPDGIAVGLMSPTSPERKTPPPEL